MSQMTISMVQMTIQTVQNCHFCGTNDQLYGRNDHFYGTDDHFCGTNDHLYGTNDHSNAPPLCETSLEKSISNDIADEINRLDISEPSSPILKPPNDELTDFSFPFQYDGSNNSSIESDELLQPEPEHQPQPLPESEPRPIALGDFYTTVNNDVTIDRTKTDELYEVILQLKKEKRSTMKQFNSEIRSIREEIKKLHRNLNELVKNKNEKNVQLTQKINEHILKWKFFDCGMPNNTSLTSFVHSNKGGSQLVHDDFVFNLNKKTTTKRYWRCTMTNCTVYIHTDTNNNLLHITGEHNHLFEPETLRVKQFRTVLKERVVNETVPIQKIYDEEIAKANLSVDVLASIPLAHHIQPGLNQARRKLTPILPESNSFNIPEGYQTTASGEPFLICDNSIIFLDGTFRSTPPFFDQIFTIHGLKFDCAFPCIFALLPDRKKSTYQQLFKELNAVAVSMGRTWKPDQIMSDFETSLIPAISTEFPESVHKGCYFHFSQCLYRRIQSLGLATAYSHDESVRSCCRKLMALPLLPIQEVETSFYDLRATADPTLKQQLRELFLYFDEYWINNIPIKMWNIHDNQHRTNNICEGFHNRFNRRMEQAHANIWSFIRCIVREESRFQHLYVQINTGSKRRPRSSYTNGIQKRIDTLMQRYNNKQID
ncbi:unnamed protein product, partial [Rotaria socialis]